MKIYAIYDKKSESHGPLFECPHDAVAIRELGAAVAQERSTLARYPDDFELHYLGDKAANWTASELAPIPPCVPEVVISVRAWIDAQPKEAN